MLMDYLSKIEHAPSVQFQSRVPDTEVPEEVNPFCNQIYWHLVLPIIFI